MPRPKKEVVVKNDEAGEMYSMYVHGTPINQIAEKYKVEVQEVVEVIQAAEAARAKE